MVEEIKADQLMQAGRSLEDVPPACISLIWCAANTQRCLLTANSSSRNWDQCPFRSTGSAKEPLLHTRARAHTHTHAYTPHAHTHARTPTHTRTHSFTHTCARTHTHEHTHVSIYTHTSTWIHKSASTPGKHTRHSCPLIRSDIQTQAYSHVHEQTSAY